MLLFKQGLTLRHGSGFHMQSRLCFFVMISLFTWVLTESFHSTGDNQEHNKANNTTPYEDDSQILLSSATSHMAAGDEAFRTTIPQHSTSASDVSNLSYKDTASNLVFTGFYALYDMKRLTNDTRNNTKISPFLPPYSQGKLTLVVLSRSSFISSLQLVATHLTLEDFLSQERHTLRLSGLENSQARSIVLHGVTPSSQLFLSKKDREEKNFLSDVEPNEPLRAKERNTTGYATLDSSKANVCTLSGSIHLMRPLSQSTFSGFMGLLEDNDRLREWGFGERNFWIRGGDEESPFNSFRLLAGASDDKGNSSPTTHTLSFINENVDSPADIFPGTRSSPQTKKNIRTQQTSTRTVSHHSIHTGRRNIPSLIQENIQTNIQKEESIFGIELNDGFLLSSDCGIKMLLSFSEVNLYNVMGHVGLFGVFFVIKCLFEFYFLIQQYRYTNALPLVASKVSFMSLGLHATVDCFECIVLFREFLTTKLMSLVFLFLAIVKIVFLSAVELPYIVVVLKARFQDTEHLNDITRYLKLHTSGTGLFLVFIFQFLTITPKCILLLYGFWFPQILLDIKKGHRQPLDPSYIVGMSTCRILFPLYLWGYKDSIFNGLFYQKTLGAPDFKLSGWIILLTFLQVTMLILQWYYGARCFVPASLFPDTYNYYRFNELPEDLNNSLEEGGCFECVICMLEKSYIKQTMVVTPCNHFFHEACLLNWITVKLECPTCRSPLPPFL